MENVWRKTLLCLTWWSRGIFAIPHTNGFIDKTERLQHWSDHAQDFGSGHSEMRYEYMADRFLTGPLIPVVLDCRRIRRTNRYGDYIRFNQTTGEFGVLSKSGIIKTYFKPMPCCWLPAGYARPGVCHGEPSNLDYFSGECRK